MSKVYQYDNLGFLLGTTEDYDGPMPNNCTGVTPPEETLAKWERYRCVNGQWRVGHDYRGAEGYVAGNAVTVKTPELPPGFSFTAPLTENVKERAFKADTMPVSLAATDFDAASVPETDFAGLKEDVFAAFAAGDMAKVRELRAAYGVRERARRLEQMKTEVFEAFMAGDLDKIEDMQAEHGALV